MMTTMTGREGLARIAAVIFDAEDERGWSQSEAARECHISLTTYRKASGRIDGGEMTAKTRRQLEKGFGWPRRYLDDVADGRVAIPGADSTAAIAEARRLADEFELKIQALGVDQETADYYRWDAYRRMRASGTVRPAREDEDEDEATLAELIADLPEGDQRVFRRLLQAIHVRKDIHPDGPIRERAAE